MPATTSTRILTCDDLVAGEDVFFSATGVTDGDVLQGVRYQGERGATTESLVMRSRSGTVRRVLARHDRAKLRTLTGVRLRLSRALLAGAAAGFSVDGRSPPAVSIPRRFGWWTAVPTFDSASSSLANDRRNAWVTSTWTADCVIS